MKRITYLKTLLVGLLVCGVTSAWAESTVIYERGTTNAWSTDDLTDWVPNTTNEYFTYSINGGLFLENTSANTNFKSPYYSTKTISPSKNSIITMTAVAVMGTASGRSSSYDYITIGGVSLHQMPQGGANNSSIAQVFVDGVAQGDPVSSVRGGTYTFHVSINQATGAVLYSVSGGTTISEAAATTTTNVTSVTFGHSRGGSENYNTSIKLTNIDISEEPQSVTSANYSIRYIANISGTETEIKETVTRSGVVGNSINLVDADKERITYNGVNYKYSTDDASSQTIASNGLTVVTVSFVETPSYTYSVVDNLENTIASGSAYEGDDVYYWVPYFAFKNNRFYKSPSPSIGSLSYAQGVITAIAANTNITVTYQEEENTNVVFYSEAENLEGVTVVEDTYTRIRMSNGKTGYFAEQAIFATLPAGTYRLTAATRLGATTFYAGAVGEGTEIASISSTGSVVAQTSEPFTLTTETGIYASVGSQSAYFDYVIIEKVPQQFTYTVNAVNDNEEFIKNIAEGNAVEGETVTIPYNKYILADGKLLVASGKDDNNKQFSTTFTLNDNYEGNIIYKESGINDVVFYAEGEDIAGCTVVSAGTISQRGSGMKGAAGTNINITTLPEGRYIVAAQYGGKNNQEYKFFAGEDEIISVKTSGAILEFVSSSIITLNNETTLTYSGGYATQTATNAHGLDFVYIQSVPETVPVTISNAGYATYINSKYPLDFSNVSGLTAYVASVDGDRVSFTEVEKIPANTGVLLKGAADTYQIPVVTDGGDVTSILIGGTTAAPGSFVLMKKDDSAAFFKCHRTLTLSPNTAYIPAQTISAREVIAIDGEATGISAVNAEQQGAEVYNLNGQRVSKAQKGLYIQNGKKVIMK